MNKSFIDPIEYHNRPKVVFPGHHVQHSPGVEVNNGINRAEQQYEKIPTLRRQCIHLQLMQF